MAELRPGVAGEAMAGKLPGETSADGTGTDASAAHFGTAHPPFSITMGLFTENVLLWVPPLRRVASRAEARGKQQAFCDENECGLSGINERDQ